MLPSLLLLPPRASRFGRDRSRNGETLKLKIAIVTEEIVSKQDLGPDRCRAITAPDSGAATLWTILRDHSCNTEARATLGSF